MRLFSLVFFFALTHIAPGAQILVTEIQNTWPLFIFPEAVGPRTKLTFWVDCVDVPTRDSAKNIFLSIRFK